MYTKKDFVEDCAASLQAECAGLGALGMPLPSKEELERQILDAKGIVVNKFATELATLTLEQRLEVLFTLLGSTKVLVEIMSTFWEKKMRQLLDRTIEIEKKIKIP